MQRDEGGRLHLSVTLFGPWSHALDHDLRWLTDRLPPEYPRQRTRIDDVDSCWFSNVQTLLPPRGTRTEPVQLHVSALSGTLIHEGIETKLAALADVIIFVAPRSRLDLATHYRKRLAAADATPLRVFQLDDDEDTPAPLDDVRAALDVGNAPCIATTSRLGEGVGEVFRAATQLAFDAATRGELAKKPLPAPVIPL